MAENDKNVLKDSEKHQIECAKRLVEFWDGGLFDRMIFAPKTFQWSEHFWNGYWAYNLETLMEELVESFTVVSDNKKEKQ